MSPTQRALAYCKAQGWTAGIAERWNPHARIRQDLLGFADLVVLDGLRAMGVLAVQVTSDSHVADRCKKLEALDSVKGWLLSGGRVQVWGWAKKGPRGKRKVWTLRKVWASLGLDGSVCWWREEQAAAEREGA